MAIPLEWKASIYGAEDVKNKLAEIRTEYQNGGMGIQEYTQKSSYLTRQLRQSNQSLQMQKSVFLATHPALNKLSQAMSVYGSVSRTVLGVMNAINISSIASHQNDQQLFDAKMALMEEQNKLNRMMEAGITGPVLNEQIAKVNELKAAVKGVQDEMKRQDAQQFITNITAIGTLSAQAVTSIILMLPQIAKLRTSLALLTPISWAAAGPWAIIAAGLVAFGVAFYYANSAVSDFFTNWSLHTGGSFAWGEMISIFFSTTLPKVLATAWASVVLFFGSFGQLVGSSINTVIKALETFINAFISVINAMINAYNRIASRLKLPKLGTIGQVSLPTVGGGTGASSGGSQAVPFAGSQFSKSAGGVTIIVQGSILSQRELEKITDDALKNNLKRVGFG